MNEILPQIYPLIWLLFVLVFFLTIIPLVLSRLPDENVPDEDKAPKVKKQTEENQQFELYKELQSSLHQELLSLEAKLKPIHLEGGFQNFNQHFQLIEDSEITELIAETQLSQLSIEGVIMEGILNDLAELLVKNYHFKNRGAGQFDSIQKPDSEPQVEIIINTTSKQHKMRLGGWLMQEQQNPNSDEVKRARNCVNEFMTEWSEEMRLKISDFENKFDL